jgi:cytosine/adenosine deaminase-related metal-dependent hydrolase
MALSAQRALDNDEARKTQGQLPSTSTVSCEEALGWITIQGARALGLEDRIGSLSPGKQADMVLIRADLLNMLPLHDPVASVVMQTSLANVDTVLVAGEIRKRNGRLVFPSLDARLAELDESGRRIAGGLTQRLAAH